METKKSPRYFTTFYARRFIRIFPLYYFVLFVTFNIFPAVVHVDEAGQLVILNQAWLWTYTQNLSWLFGQGGWDESHNFFHFSHFWSLSVEEHFYILWPLIVYFVKDKLLPQVMWGIISISAFSVIFVYLTGDLAPILKWSTIRCAGVLSLGGLIAYYWRQPEKFRLIYSKSAQFIWYAGLVFFIFNFIPRQYRINYVLTFFSSVTFFALLLIVSLNGNRVTNRLFNQNVIFHWQNKLWNICLSWITKAIFCKLYL